MAWYAWMFVWGVLRNGSPSRSRCVWGDLVGAPVQGTPGAIDETEGPRRQDRPRSFGEAYLAETHALVLEEIRTIIRAGTSADERTYGLMLDYPLRRAKGLRPALALAVARALGGDLHEALSSAAVLEIYHNAFLIHDDIEDGSLERRGRPALHQTHGIPTAINCGDGLLALTLRPLLDNTDRLGLGRALRILEIYAAMVTETFEGQAEELRWIAEGIWDLTDADYEGMVLKKTCSYSFVAPARVGAAVAGASAEIEARLTPFFRHLGLAFQIQDDILNLEEQRASYGKEVRGDLWEGKRTLMLLHALRGATASDRERALAVLAKPRPAHGAFVSDLGAVLAELRDAGTLDESTATRILKHAEARGERGYKTEGDVRFLGGLLDAHDSMTHARTVAARHAATAEAAWAQLAPTLGESPHTRFLHWLKDYVVRREW